jgi:D-amino-acid oxidase
MSQRVTVVGAGVVGLTCAVRLAEAGHEVAVLARDLPLETTSAVAGGLWLPYLAEPADEVARRARVTFTELARLAADPAEADRAGVRLVPGRLLAADGGPRPVGTSRPPRPPAWAATLDDLVRLVPVADPTPVHRSGWRVTLPLVDMLRYLPWLQARLVAAGGTLTRLPVPRLPGRGLVVNCTGVAARALAGDDAVHPVRGQTVLVADPGLQGWWCEDDGGRHTEVAYVLPHGRHVVVGGTAQDGDWSTTPDPADAERLLARAVQLVPALRGAEVLGHRVGLRPARGQVRTEVERRPHADDPDHAVVHCYGHGGSGLTQSWGSADDVLGLVERVGQPVRD